MGKEEQFLYGDYDGESKDFRKTFGKVGIILGILFFIFNSYFFVRDMTYVIGGESFVANIVRTEVYTVAEYEHDGRTYSFDLDEVQIGNNQKNIRFYYKGDIKEAIAVNWRVYILSYFVYIIMFCLGILGVKNIRIKDIIKKIRKK